MTSLKTSQISLSYVSESVKSNSLASEQHTHTHTHTHTHIHQLEGVHSVKCLAWIYVVIDRQLFMCGD